MFNSSKYIDTLYNYENMQQMLLDAIDVSGTLFTDDLKTLDIYNYKYEPAIAVEELGLDLELVNQLVDDYVNQILKANIDFIKYLDKLQDDKDNDIELDYTELRELAHKNLGVARNLRIEDARKLLYRIMKEDDLDYVFKCIKGLAAATVILRPKSSYNTLKLMKIKDSI